MTILPGQRIQAATGSGLTQFKVHSIHYRGAFNTVIG
jgi:hypothetical protein